MNYPIEIRNNIPYVGDILESRYVVAHETANPTATLMNEVTFMERNWRNAFVTHFVGDGGKIVQVSPPGKLCYGAGGKANPYSYAQVELCRDKHNKEIFDKNYQAYLWLLRDLRKKAGLPNEVDNGRGIVSHLYVSQHLGGTTHTDPYDFLRLMGVSKEQFIKDLRNDSGWQKLDGAWYYLQHGKRAIGWLQLEGLWYYFYDDGKMATGWQLVKDKWYYLESSGAMKTGWYYYHEKWYYLDKMSGAMVSDGMKEIDGKKYYFEEHGAMRDKGGFHPLTWFALKENGEVLTGWYKLNNLWYYLGQDGVMVTGWVKDNENWYYLDGNGVMIANTERYIGNKLYTFDLSGKCLNP